MRVVSYNILKGGVGRADPIAEVLLAQKPDVVGLVEATDPEILDRIAWRLGFDYVHAPSPNGKWGSALLSRLPIESSTNVAALRFDGPRSFLWATLQGEIDVGVLHLTSKPREKKEKKRIEQLRAMLDVTADARQAGRRHVLMGDFNATMPDWPLDRSIVPKRHRDAVKKQGDVPRAAMATMLAAGYEDSHAGTKSPTLTTLRPWLKVDHILSRGLTCGEAWIETDRLAQYASDHFPVGASFEVDAK